MTIDEKQQEELIPKLQVLDDMYADKGVVSMAARDYYYIHYADKAERKRMDIEDVITTFMCISLLGLAIIFIIAAIIGG